MRRAVLLLLPLAFAACGGGSSSHTIHGTITLFTSCASSDYDDIDQGTQVVVKDGEGKILATTELGKGKNVNPAKTAGLDSDVLDALTSCDYRFTAVGVPDAAFYSVEASHRGALTYSRAKLEKAEWKVALSLGP